VRSEFRDVAWLRRDRFLTADIIASILLQAGRCRAERVHPFSPERFHILAGGNQFVQVMHDAVLPQKPGRNIHN
jgi:hypothetical protein